MVFVYMLLIIINYQNVLENFHDPKFVRVDLYELENEVRLGELTFIPMNSIFTCENKSSS